MIFPLSVSSVYRVSSSLNPSAPMICQSAPPGHHTSLDPGAFERAAENRDDAPHSLRQLTDLEWCAHLDTRFKCEHQSRSRWLGGACLRRRACANNQHSNHYQAHRERHSHHAGDQPMKDA